MFNLLEPETGRKKITHENYREIFPYSAARTEVLQYWHDQVWLVGDKMFYEIVDDVLYICKDTKFYGKPIFFLAFPPMTRERDLEREHTLMQQKLDEGVPVVCSSEDLKLYEPYGIDNWSLTFKQHQYVYRCADFVELRGKRWLKWRYALNRFSTDGLTFEAYGPEDQVPADVWPQVDAIIEEWKVQQKEKGESLYKALKWWIRGFDKIVGRVLFLVRDPEGKIIGYTIHQVISDRNVIYCDDKSSRKALQSFPFFLKAVHAKIAQWHYENSGTEVYMNKGASMDKGMTESKKSLRPFGEFKLYRVVNA